MLIGMTQRGIVQNLRRFVIVSVGHNRSFGVRLPAHQERDLAPLPLSVLPQTSLKAKRSSGFILHPLLAHAVNRLIARAATITTTINESTVCAMLKYLKRCDSICVSLGPKEAL
jgi:hypothetical protein